MEEMIIILHAFLLFMLNLKLHASMFHLNYKLENSLKNIKLISF